MAEERDMVLVPPKPEQYSGNARTEHRSALDRAANERAMVNAMLADQKALDYRGLAADKSAVNAIVKQNLDRARQDATGSYARQTREMGPMTATAAAMLKSAYQDSMGSAYQSARDANAAALHQFGMNRNNLQSRYGQMRYGATQDMYARANDNRWKQLDAGMRRDSDQWNRWNTETQQAQQQGNLDREYDFSYEQWLENDRIRAEELALQNQAFERSLAAARSGGGSGRSSGGSSGSGSGRASGGSPNTTLNPITQGQWINPINRRLLPRG